MSRQHTYKLTGIVLRKTKLGEKDLIVSVLSESGELVRAVAKGARKPGGSLAARLELFSTSNLMLATGRSLDVITEARLAQTDSRVSFDLEQAACAAPIAELVDHIAQEGLSQPRLFEMTQAALHSIALSDAVGALLVCGADILKTLALAGFKPSVDACVLCGSAIPVDDGGYPVSVSIAEGGAFCRSCPKPSDAIPVDANVCQWVRALLAARFADVSDMGIDTRTAFELLHFARSWARFHTGRDLKSLDFLFTSGLY